MNAKNARLEIDWKKRASEAASRAPRRQHRQRHPLRWGLLGATAGAAAMFMLDPRTGNRRRALLRDQFVHFGNVAGDFVNDTLPQKLDYASGFVRGLQHQALETVSGESHWTDDSQTITDRVMSEVFRDPDLPKGEINVNTVDHVVYLRGHVENPALVKEIESRTRQVPGVRNVVNLINHPDVDPSTVRPGFDNRTENPQS